MHRKNITKSDYLIVGQLLRAITEGNYWGQTTRATIEGITEGNYWGQTTRATIEGITEGNYWGQPTRAFNTNFILTSY
jgi:hypothetical protein